MDNPQTPFWGRKTFCLITGASQGIGRQFAIELSQIVGEGSLFLLLARSETGLTETKRLINETGSTAHVVCCTIDLHNASSTEMTSILTDSLLKLKTSPTDFDLAMIVHNAGTVGDVSEATNNMCDAQKWIDYLSLNFVSMACLNSVFLNSFSAADPLKEICIVNITSLCAVKPFKSMGYYCVGKASREMFFRVLADENPRLNVLSYSPGMVDTNMVTEVIDKLADVEVRQTFISNKPRILTAKQTVQRCVQVLEARKYKSGDRVDYFDDLY